MDVSRGIRNATAVLVTALLVVLVFFKPFAKQFMKKGENR